MEVTGDMGTMVYPGYMEDKFLIVNNNGYI